MGAGGQALETLCGFPSPYAFTSTPRHTFPRLTELARRDVAQCASCLASRFWGGENRRRSQAVFLPNHVVVAQKIGGCPKMGRPGKWNRGLKPGVPWLPKFESHPLPVEDSQNKLELLPFLGLAERKTKKRTEIIWGVTYK